MALLRLITCIVGVYATFLIWGVAQERLSAPFSAIVDGKEQTSRWSSAFVMGALQSFFSMIASAAYIWIRKPSIVPFSEALGLSSKPPIARLHNGNGHAVDKPATSWTRAPLGQYFYVSLIAASAAPFGFASLSHISYPAMVLGKSCKLIPVMLMNVVLYRRRFAPHKYLVVFLVTAGITLFMWSGKSRSSKKDHTSSGSSLIGLLYLFINLLLDGLLNSTQDTLIANYSINGQQLMFFMGVFLTLINTFLALLPLPYVPVLHPSDVRTPDLFAAWTFLQTYPAAWRALLQFACTGALGQLFIFETLAHFGSLTLVTITLTRKLFTMLLSVVVYGHKLTRGQYIGAVIVFLGISVEAWIKRRDINAKKVLQEKQKPKIKEL